MGTTVPVVQGAAKALRFFDRIAPWYDRINARIYQRKWLERMRAEIHGVRVLDVGVGTGFTTGHLTASVGIDLSREMLKRARYQGHLIRADVMHPPFRPGVFDTIVFAGSFYYLPSPEAGATITANLLRFGGRVIILSPATRLLALFVRVYRPEEYRQFMEGAGLRLLRYERLNWAACLVIAERPKVLKRSTSEEPQRLKASRSLGVRRKEDGGTRRWKILDEHRARIGP